MLLQNWTLKHPEYGDLPCSVPFSMYGTLLAAGKINDPYYRDNEYALKPLSNEDYTFETTFEADKARLAKAYQLLRFEGIDTIATLYLNDIEIGQAFNMHRTWEFDVREALRLGTNRLTIEFHSPVKYMEAEQARHYVWGQDGDIITMDGFAHIRKAASMFGWDWAPQLPDMGLFRPVTWISYDTDRISDVRIRQIHKNGKVTLKLEAESEHNAANLTFTVRVTGPSFDETVTLVRGKGQLTIDEPQLWWPNGYGDQPLYTARVVARNVGGARDEQSVRTGIRTVELDNSKYSDVERRYAFRVNGKQIYCKGMDLIHTDHIYARAKRETYESLIRDAKAAHFTMFRFWAEGVYEPDYVYELCDEQGILVYRTMIFACGAYPDHLPWFNDLVEQEVRYQMLRLRNHPCMAVWCGGGECLSVLNSYFGAHYPDHDDITRRPGGTTIYGQLMPRIHHELIASVPYVCNSAFGMLPADQAPYRGGGDRHFYPFLNTKPEYQQTRISVDSFADFKAQFVTEGGVMGPPSPQALIRYCGGREHIADDDPIFTHHRNSFEYFAVRDAVYRHYTGEKQLSLEEYCLYGGLFQGDLLSYEADQIRTTENCSGSVLWCYTDGFGEVGFSLMDHYANPKPAYYFMRRAYHPHRVVVRRCEDELRIYCANDLPEAATLDLTCGYVSFDGTYAPARTLTVRLDAFTQSALIATVPVDGSWDLQRGAFYVRGEGIPTVTFRAGDFRTLTLPRATLSVSDFCREGDTLHFTVQTDCFAHAVHFNLGDEVRLSDQYFDLLPGESRRISIFNADGITPDMVRPTSVYPD